MALSLLNENAFASANGLIYIVGLPQGDFYRLQDKRAKFFRSLSRQDENSN
jgi:hypothetical protein